MARSSAHLNFSPAGRRSTKCGFTLIELSIVLVIIGLIIGGILVGRDLIETANIRAMISQMEKYKTAFNAFRVKFGSMPGDISPEKASGFGFAARTGEKGRGDENGLISNCDPDGTIDGQDTGAKLGCENLLFWRDLSDAQMVDGSFATAIDDWATDLTAASVPLYLPYSRGTTADAYLLAFSHRHNWVSAASHSTNYLIITDINGTNTNARATRGNPLTPQMAFVVDQKIDDSLPFDGTVRGWTVTNTPSPPQALYHSFFYPTMTGITPNCIFIDFTIQNFAYSLSPDNRNKLVCTISTSF